MRYFLIDFERRIGKCHRFDEYDEYERCAKAMAELELEHHRAGIQRAVVILHAESKDALRLTHGRYFRVRKARLG